MLGTRGATADDHVPGWEAEPTPGRLTLSAVDEWPFHQTTAPFPVPATSDSHFNDGYYFGFFREGVFGYFGLRVHPNNNVLDGFAGAVVAGEQRTVRASRALRPRVGSLDVGPLRLTVVEPMVSQRLELDENATGIAFDVTFTASAPPYLESPDIHFRHGRLYNHVLRYTQVCRATGELCIDGETTEVDGWYADRDHSWGIRASMGPHVPIHGLDPGERDPRAIRIWLPFELESRTGFFSLHEDRFGNRLDFDGLLRWRDGRTAPLAAARHAFRYVEGTSRVTGGVVTLVTADGEEHDLSFEVVGDPATPQAFGYVRGWSDGRQPGVWRGAELVESDRFRVDDPHGAAGPEHVPVERRMAPCEYPVAVTDGVERGLAQLEHMVYGPYEPYGFGS